MNTLSAEVPLVETHLHTDCAHTPASVKKVADQYSIKPFQGKSEDEVRQIIQAAPGSNWAQWYSHLKNTRLAYISPKVIGVLVEDVIRDAKKAGVDLLELRLSLLSTVDALIQNSGTRPTEPEYWKLAVEVFEEILKGVERTRAEGMETDLIMSVSCQQKYFPFMDSLFAFCKDYKDHLIALDLTNEKETSPTKYHRHLSAIRGDIRFLTMHCMEVMPPERGWDALTLDPDRIGHGLRAAEDPILMSELARRQIPLEICVLSNQVTGVIKRVEDHPLRQFKQAGMALVIGSDGCNDGSTLQENYDLIHNRLGFTPEEMLEFRKAGVKHAFRNMQK